MARAGVLGNSGLTDGFEGQYGGFYYIVSYRVGGFYGVFILMVGFRDLAVVAHSVASFAERVGV